MIEKQAIAKIAIILAVLVILVFIIANITTVKPSKFYTIDSLEDCKSLLPSIETYCPSVGKLETIFIAKDSNPFLELFKGLNGTPDNIKDATFKSPPSCFWDYIENPKEGSLDPFIQIFTSKRLTISARVYESKEEASKDFTLLMENIKDQTLEEQKHNLDVSIKYPTPYSYEKETKPPVSTPSLNEPGIFRSIVTLKDNVVLSIATFEIESQDPLCSSIEISNLIDSF